MNVLLLGRTSFHEAKTREEIGAHVGELHTGTNLEDVRAAFAKSRIDAVLMGAGLPIETRLEIVQLVFSLSASTTVHMKDFDSGKEGMMPFVNGVLTGLGR